MKKLLIALALLATSVSVSGCSIAPYPGYYGYRYHPSCYYHRCY